MPRIPRKWLIIPLAATAVVVSYASATMPDDNLHVSFLDVGQGDAILIQQGSQQVIIDGGPSPQALSLALGEQMPFWDRTIEMVILTHPNSDHIAGLVEVLKRYHIERVIYPEIDYDSNLYDEWLRLIDENGIESTPAQAGQVIDLGNGTILEVLNPQEPPLIGTQSDADNNGALIRLSAGKISFLMAADIMWEAELELIHNRAPLKSTVLKVGHHGSDTSSSAGFLAAVDPRIAVISVGADNDYGHPSSEVLARLSEVTGPENIYRTDKNGSIEFTTNSEKLWVQTER